MDWYYLSKEHYTSCVIFGVACCILAKQFNILPLDNYLAALFLHAFGGLMCLFLVENYPLKMVYKIANSL